MSHRRLHRRFIVVASHIVAFGLTIGCASRPIPDSPERHAAAETPQSEIPRESRSIAQADAPSERAQEWLEAFPGVRVNKEAREVEFDGEVAINAHNPDTPVVYIEAFVCIPDSKEHESLIATKAKPSHVHAALLALGYSPGKPGHWVATADAPVPQPVNPTGDELRVSIVLDSSTNSTQAAQPHEWVKHISADSRLVPSIGQPAFVFAGSRLIDRGGRSIYDADLAGVLVGLHTFGGEVIAWGTTLSPWASVEEPVWIADASRVPKQGTPVRVRIGPAFAPSSASP